MPNGDAIDVRDWYGNPIRDDTFLLLLNAAHESVDFILPSEPARHWTVVIDTMDESGFVTDGGRPAGDAALPLAERSLILLKRVA